MGWKKLRRDKTVRAQITSLWGERKVELRETPRAVTPWGGLVVFVEYLRKIGYLEAVGQHLPFELTSPNAIDPVQTFTAFLVSVVVGARRFAQTGLLRADEGEERGLAYIVVARLTRWLKREAGRVQEWRALDEDFAVGEFRLQLFNWDRARRFLVIRERVKEKQDSAGKKLLDIPGYT